MYHLFIEIGWVAAVLFATSLRQYNSMAENIEHYLRKHYIHRSNWLRAAVLGANDGIISIASLGIGMASSGGNNENTLLAVCAGVVAGAFSMAAGEYVSVSSQTDIERADIRREEHELKESPEEELEVLTSIYVGRGLSHATALQVAKELTAHDALGAHIRDELGINENSAAKPGQAALASGAAFTCGGLLPAVVCMLVDSASLVLYMYVFAILFLVLLGGISARAGGSPVWKAVVRITLWGTLAMAASALAGNAFGAYAG